MVTMVSLCDTAKLIASVLDGASERAVLVADDGTVLHMNSAAEHFVRTKSDPPHVLDFLFLDEGEGDWRKAKKARIVMKKNGQPTRTHRDLHWMHPSACPCGCPHVYHTVYISSKHERVRELVDHAFDPVLTANCKGNHQH